MTLEVDIEERAVTLASGLGVTALKLNLTGNAGWPDRLFLIPGGRPFFIEFKQPLEEPEPRQRLIHAHLTYLGYDCETHSNAEEAITAIRLRLDAAAKAGWRHSARKAAAALAAAHLPKAGRKVPGRAGGGGVVP